MIDAIHIASFILVLYNFNLKKLYFLGKFFHLDSLKYIEKNKKNPLTNGFF